MRNDYKVVIFKKPSFLVRLDRTYIFEASSSSFLFNCGILFLLGGSACLFIRWKTNSCRKTYIQSVIESNLHVLRQMYDEENVILA